MPLIKSYGFSVSEKIKVDLYFEQIHNMFFCFAFFLSVLQNACAVGVLPFRRFYCAINHGGIRQQNSLMFPQTYVCCAYKEKITHISGPKSLNLNTFFS